MLPYDKRILVSSLKRLKKYRLEYNYVHSLRY